jgi:hypothetical protein
MKTSCDIITDLLPLYHDEVCNESSKKLVEEHLEECSTCKDLLEKMKDNPLDERIKKEREYIVGKHIQAVKRKFLIGLTIAMAIPIVVTFIVNLATARTLDWFLIVSTALIVFGSLTLVPLGVEKDRGLWTLGSFTGSLILMLFTIDSLYGGRSWFLIPAASILLGASVLFAPYVLTKLPLTGFASHHKGFLAMISNTLLLYMVIIVIGLHASTGYWREAFLITSVCLIFPWLVFLTIRYFKTNVLIKTGLCFFYTGLFFSMINSVIDWIVDGVWYNQLRYANLFPGEWIGYRVINANISLLSLLIGCIVGSVFLIAGLLQRKKC